MPKEREMSVAEKVYHMLMSQEFDDWYSGEFLKHVLGEDDTKPKDMLIDEIKSMLGA